MTGFFSEFKQKFKIQLPASVVFQKNTFSKKSNLQKQTGNNIIIAIKIVERY